MIVYWLMYLLPLAVIAMDQDQGLAIHRDRIWMLFWLLFTFLIGFRYEVGGDWGSYLNNFQLIVGASPSEVLSMSEPGYHLLEWLSDQLGWGIYGVNVACGALVMYGVYTFCRQQPQPWIALAVAVPYLIIVVAMGYTRQSVALGLELIALAALSNGRLVTYALLILVAATFHRTALILLPVAILSTSYTNVWIQRLVVAATAAAVAGLVGLTAFEQESHTYFVNYVQAQMISEGANIRVAMNALPAAIFLFFAKRLTRDKVEQRTWTLISVLSLACIPALSYTSTAVDRIALYLIPIQLFVFSRLGIVRVFEGQRTLINSAILVTYAGALFVLLNYAPIVSVFWVPYQNAAFLN